MGIKRNITQRLWGAIALFIAMTLRQTLPAVQAQTPPTFAQGERLTLLNKAEIHAAQSSSEASRSTWLGLAGVGKSQYPPHLTTALQDYRRVWQKIDPAIAPFLGYWQDDTNPAYSLTIFPHKTRGKACILEFQPEWSLDILNEATNIYGKDIISPEILSLSVAEAHAAQLRSSRIRAYELSRTLIPSPLDPVQTVEFMPFADTQNNFHTLAAADLPHVSPEMPANLATAVTQSLEAEGCLLNKK